MRLSSVNTSLKIINKRHFNAIVGYTLHLLIILQYEVKVI
jgi:hypothetical protein